jgi:hypothetical protein
MRSLLVLVLLAALAIGGFLSKPGIEAHRAHAAKELAKTNGEGDAIGDLIGSVFSNRTDTFEDLVVATKLTTREGDKTVLECWGVFSQFFCSKPPNEAGA